jgi:hypothetical protein
MKASDVAFCSSACREAAKVICHEVHLPFELYQNLMKAHGILELALHKITEQVPIEKESA